MIVALKTKISFRYFLLWGIALALFGCSTSRHISRSDAKVYAALGLKKERKDNVLLYREAAAWLHTPYVSRGTSRKGTDCSSFVFSLYQTVYKKNIERNAAAILSKNCKRISRNQLREGDLIFFNTSGKSASYVNHVGLYLKENKFIHASLSKGVIVSDLDEPYYRKAWICGGRVR
jgi:cell wall-associated NlpC family hydrolase